MNMLLYYAVATLLLSVERFYYAFVYIFPQRFISFLQRTGRTKKEPWRYFEDYFCVIKTLQVGVILYDLIYMVHATLYVGTSLYLGSVLFVIGQVMNFGAFAALGRQGIFYGNELGSPVPYATGFPYNLGVADPQYWGAVITIYGMYIAVEASTFTVAYISTFWYVSSMVLLENDRGRRWFGAVQSSKEN